MYSKLIKESLGMAWPLVGNRILMAITNFYAMWFLAHMGKQTLAAGALIFVIQVMVLMVMSAVLLAIAPIVGRAFGTKDYQKIGAVAQQGWLLSVLLIVPSVLFLWFIQPILLLVHQSSALTAIVAEYFHVYIWAIIPSFLFTTNQFVLMGIHKQRLAFLSSFVAAIVLLVITPLVTLGKLGLPALGIKGVALGMVASAWAGLFFSFYCLSRVSADFALFKLRLHKSWAYLKQILIIGWPVTLRLGGEVLAWVLTTLMIGWLGEQALSAQQIVSQFNILVMMPVIGLSRASSVLIGLATGAKRHQEVKQLGLVNIYIGVVFMLVVMLMYLSIPTTLIHLYIGKKTILDPHIEHLAKWLFVVSAFTMFFDAIRNLCMGTLRGVYDSYYPMISSLVIIWLIGLPLSYYFGFSLHGGVVGFALANLIAMILITGLLLYRWHNKVDYLMAKADVSDAKHR